MRKTARFIYLNTYAILILICGITAALLPLYKVSWWLIIPQAVVCLFCLKQAVQLFSSWNDKMRKYDILIKRNKTYFHPNSFKPFMNAPCGRLLVKAVLHDLGISNRYKELLVFREPFLVRAGKNCTSQETKIYINEDIM